MTYVKDLLFSLIIIVLVLFATALDDSYEDSTLSAQVLDEAITQAYAEQKTASHVLHAQQTKADF